MLGILRNLKFRVGRKALNQIYYSYLRPLLDDAYGMVVLYMKKEKWNRFNMRQLD